MGEGLLKKLGKAVKTKKDEEIIVAGIGEIKKGKEALGPPLEKIVQKEEDAKPDTELIRLLQATVRKLQKERELDVSDYIDRCAYDLCAIPLTPDGNILIMGKHAREITGYSAEYFDGKRVSIYKIMGEYSVSGKRKEFRELFERFSREDEPTDVEVQCEVMTKKEEITYQTVRLSKGRMGICYLTLGEKKIYDKIDLMDEYQHWVDVPAGLIDDDLEGAFPFYKKIKDIIAERAKQFTESDKQQAQALADLHPLAIGMDFREADNVPKELLAKLRSLAGLNVKLSFVNPVDKGVYKTLYDNEKLRERIWLG